jgi:branched-chain amino acid transport system substrate-binding protein
MQGLQWHQGMRKCLIPLLLLPFLLSGCARLKALLGTQTTPTPPTWQIGIVGAALGPGGIEGTYSGNGAQLAIETLNAQGGIPWQGQRYQLGAIFGTAPDVVDRVRALAFQTPPVVAIFGPDESAPAVAALPLIASAHIPTLTLALDDTLTNPAQNQQATTLFRLRPPQAEWARTLASYAAQHLAGQIALASVDDAYGQAGTATIKATLATANVALAAQVTLPVGLADATQAVSQIQAAQATTVICWSTEAEAVTLLQGLHAAGWQGQFLIGQADADFIALAGKDGDGVLGLQSWSPTLASPASQHFVRAYVQRFGSQPEEHAAAAYDAIMLLATGLATVGPDHTALAHYLATVSNWQGVVGNYDAAHANQTLGTQGDLITALHLVIIQQGATQAVVDVP